MKKLETIFFDGVLSNVTHSYIKYVCISHFLTIVSHYNSNHDMTNLLSNSIDLGKKLINRYLVILRYKKFNDLDNNNIPRFHNWIQEWKKSYKDFSVLLQDDSFTSKLGCKFIDIL